MKRPTLFEILKTALYIGAVGYGGPAILALMKRVIVHEKEWISDEEFMNALSLSQILPGATGVTLLGYIGQKLRGGWGGILMPFAFAFPAMAAITVLAWAYFSFGDLKFVHSIFMGLGAMVVALLVNATLMMGRSVFQGMDRNAFKGIVIAALSFLGILYLRWNVVYVILISGALGALFFYFSGAVEQGKAPQRPGAAVDVPEATGWRNLLPPAALVVLLAVTFWLVDGTWTLFATFFKIGSFAFGGGFTAIPIIQSVVVDGMHWLDLTAFRDGIALGQITPGPVFITATFIGYKVQGIIGAVDRHDRHFHPFAGGHDAAQPRSRQDQESQDRQGGHPGVLVRFYRASSLCRPAIRRPIPRQLAGMGRVCGFRDLPVGLEKRRRMADPGDHRRFAPRLLSGYF